MWAGVGRSHELVPEGGDIAFFDAHGAVRKALVLATIRLLIYREGCLYEYVVSDDILIAGIAEVEDLRLKGRNVAPITP